MQTSKPEHVDDRTGAPTGSPAGAQPEAARVSVLVGDRLCTGCGYNLTGQPIVREPHYQLLVVRCPECGVVASVQDYPTLGRWAGRWAAVLAALWFIGLTGIAIGTSAAIFGLSLGASESAAREYRDTLDDLYMEWLQELHPGVDVSSRWNFETFDQWWQTIQPSQILADAGGFFRAADWFAMVLWILLFLFAMAIGTFWSTALLHLRRRGRLIFGLLMIAVPAALATAGNWSEIAGTDIDWAAEGAWHQVGLPFMGLSLVVALLGLWAGLLIGRRIIRSLIRLLLPPRLRGPLALLWTADGLAPPR